ncbi:MAG: hypothetical protein HQL44_13735, partial [Alphaproteobacteria bacterium]|nr:hypothetical protein [Alphaproteobacteria bacterium]
MTKNTQQSAYNLPDSAKTKMRDLIRRNEGTVEYPYLDKKGIITIGIGRKRVAGDAIEIGKASRQ